MVSRSPITDDVRAAAAVLLVVSLAFGGAYARLFPEAAAGAAILGLHGLWLYRTRSRAAALTVLGWSLAGVAFAVLWTLQARFAGGHVVLLALFVLWVAQRALAATLQDPSASRDPAVPRPCR